VVDFPVPEDGTVVLTTDTTVAVDAFMEGAIVTTPTVVVTSPGDEDRELVVVVTAARAAIAPGPLTAELVDTDVVPEVLDVVVDAMERITGATTAVTTAAVVRVVLGPKPLTELTEFDVVLPTAATTDVDDVLITEDSDVVEPARGNSAAEDTAGLVELDCEVGDGEVTIEGEEEEVLSTPVVLAAVDTGPVIPYGRGAKQHII